MNKKSVPLTILAVGGYKPIVASDAFKEMMKEYRENPFPALDEMNERYICDWKLGIELASDFYKTTKLNEITIEKKLI
jgi:hypothetical protein